MSAATVEQLRVDLHGAAAEALATAAPTWLLEALARAVGELATFVTHIHHHDDAVAALQSARRALESWLRWRNQSRAR